MKKLAAFAAAMLFAALMTVCAGARDVLDFEAEYHYDYDCYYLYDPDTGELAGIEYSDGSVLWFDGYKDNEDYAAEDTMESWEEYPVDEDPEPEPQPSDEAQPDTDPEDSWKSPDQLYQQYQTDTMFLQKPLLTFESAEKYRVTISYEIPDGWNFDGYEIDYDNGYGGWVYADDDWLVNDQSIGTISFYYDEPETTYTYRIRFYKYFKYDLYYVYTTELTVQTPPDYYSVYCSGGEITDTTAQLKVLSDKRLDPAQCVVMRRTSTDDPWKKLTVITEHTVDEYDPNVAVFAYSTTKLKQKTQYFYRFEVYSANGTLIGESEYDFTTLETPEDPKLLDPKAKSDSMTITVIVDDRWKADGYEVYRYNTKTKKWKKLTDSTDFDYYDWVDDVYYRSATYTDTGLKSATKYQYMVKLYRDINGEREYISKLKTSAYTLLPSPKLTLGATSSKATLTWSKVSGAAGYEVWVKPVDMSDSWNNWYYYDYGYYWYDYGDNYTTTAQYDASLSRYNQSYNSSTLGSMSISDFKKKSTIKSGSTTSTSYKITSSKAYVYIVRAYKKIGSTKVYSEYSNQETTDSTSALLNGLTLKPEVTVGEYDLSLIKSALKKCTNSKMTQAEKAAAVYDYVHNAAIYEYDYSKIPYDSIEAILSAGRGQCYQYAVTYQAMMKYLGFDVKLVSGKTSSGGPHWWCELTCAGTTYMIDPQVGGRFLIRYDRMGGYAVTREKVYD
ncbi:MAG: transglutaminase domain-containing protein [Oscillospiraceae bacterium]